MADDISRLKTTTIQKNDGRYVYETKRQGRIAHHHTDATVPHIVALLGSTFHAAKIGRLSETSKYFGIFLLFITNHRPPLFIPSAER